MKHDEIVGHVADRLMAPEIGYVVRTEWHPNDDSQRRADLAAFVPGKHRPVLIAEIKPTLTSDADLARAVDQVCHYVWLAQNEMPHATSILPIVVAEGIAATVDALPYRRRALVWDLEMFDRICQRRHIDTETEWFLVNQQRIEEFGTMPLTHETPRLAS